MQTKLKIVGARCGPAGWPRAARIARGFSLIEMLATMTVLAVLLAVATPNLGTFVTSNALSASQNELAATLMLARSEAMKRGVQVGVAALAPVTGAELSGGWLIYLDANNNGEYDDGETVLRRYPALAGSVKVSTVGGTRAFAFSPRGYLYPSGLVDITLCRAAAGQGGTGSAGNGYRIRLEPVGLSDVSEISTCT